ncbi:unnamed protein product [Strongylus vulgaris]|uniref:Peptidase M13 N-terminal domain-containing protein n=1 Tax=Strongylus vulgaris TaxID=40348 RepID=A0A3P7I7V8_STRVU|nr:unnamed protein product [Strongylus vulgaris]
MIAGIFVGFRSMIAQLNWMSPFAKTAAYKKIDYLVKNIGYPDWITDDEKLTKAYAVSDLAQVNGCTEAEKQ